MSYIQQAWLSSIQNHNMNNEVKAVETMVNSFGVKSKLIVFIVKHPFLISLILVVSIGSLHYFEQSGGYFWRVVPSIFFGIALVARILFRNFCYRIDLDQERYTIKFYLPFNKGVVESHLSTVRFQMGVFLTCLVNGRKIAYNGYIEPILKILPKEVEIQFKGWTGKQYKARIEKKWKEASG